MKNTFAASITLLLLLTLGGSILGYKKATHEEEKPAAAEAPATPATDDKTAATDGKTEPTAAGTTKDAGTPGVDNTNAAGATGNTPADKAAADNANAPAGDAEAGKAKFTATCAGCHGANAEGGVGPALNVTKDWTLDQFHTALREGRSPEKTLSSVMPKFDTTTVTDADISNLHAYFKTLN